MGLKYLAQSVAAANTPVALALTTTPCCRFTIQADKDNKDAVYFATSAASSTSDQGIILSVTSGSIYGPTQIVDAFGSPNAIDLSQVYISSAWAGARVNVIYVES